MSVYPSTMDLYNEGGYASPSDDMGVDYSGTIPPPPPPGSASIAPAPYEPMAAGPANMLGLPLASGRAKVACGWLCLGLLGALGGYVGGRKKRGRSKAVRLLAAGAGGLVASRAVPAIIRSPNLRRGTRAAVAFGGGYLVTRFAK